MTHAQHHIHQTNSTHEHNVTVETTMVFGGAGGAGATTITEHLQTLGFRAFEPQCRCMIDNLLQDTTFQAVKVVVVDASYHGVSKAAEYTAQYPVNLVVVVRKSPLSIPFGARLKMRALTGRADVVVFPHVWNWRKGNTQKRSKAYEKSLTLLAHRIYYHAANSVIPTT